MLAGLWPFGRLAFSVESLWFSADSNFVGRAGAVEGYKLEVGFRIGVSRSVFGLQG